MLGLVRSVPSLILIAAMLGAGCAPETDSDDGDRGAVAEEVAESAEQPPSTHPIENLEQLVEAPQEDEPEEAGQVVPSGRTDACGAVPASLTRDGTGRRANSTTKSLHNAVSYRTGVQNLFTRLQTKLTVPVKPPRGGTVFIWPGIQPIQGTNWSPILLGVLQPVLTWGNSCSGAYGWESWTISGMYVNVSTRISTHRGCHGGPILRVNPGDVLDLDIAKSGTVWKQTIKNLTSGNQAEYSIDLMGQEQGHALFDIELPTSAKPTADAVYTETVLSFASPRTAACVPISQGANDYVSRARLSADKTKCCIDRIAQRAPGVAATTSP